MLPAPFIRQMQDLLGAAYPEFEAALSSAPPVSIRLHPVKANPPSAIPNPPSALPIPWHPLGYYLSERPAFTFDPYWHAGAYYVQEASSMFLYEALRRATDLPPRPRILDLCAAPGGKSTLLSAFIGSEGLLVSNEYVRARVGILRENLERWGVPNIAVTHTDAAAFSRLAGWFDVVAVDAPCSGEGLFRKDPDAMREWSPKAVEHCAMRQQEILQGAVQALAPGGVLLYSTCTYNLQENEENVRWLCKRYALSPVSLEIPAEWCIESNEWGFRFFPHKLAGEGFFISVLRKPAGPTARCAKPAGFQFLQAVPKNQIPALTPWVSDSDAWRFYRTPREEIVALPAALADDFLTLDPVCNAKWFGVPLGTFKGKDFVPDHALALSLARSSALPMADLDREQALQFLRKEHFELPAGGPSGWLLAGFGGLALGWIKVMPNRM
ncbi:MAG: methyltransferase RsmF C-terminal domain-like protein, partial [Saprospiraceae bacterium]